MRSKLKRDTEAMLRSLPDEGQRQYGPAMDKLAKNIDQHAATGSSPEVVAEDVMRALTGRRPRTRYPSGAGAKPMLFLRRILPDHWFDQIILRAAGLKDF